MRIPEDEVVRRLRTHVRRSGPGLKRWAMSNGFSIEFVRSVLKGKKKPSARMCVALGIRKAMEYTLLTEAAE